MGFLFSYCSISAQVPCIQWQKNYGGSLYEVPSSIQQTTDGGYIVLGSSNSRDGQITENHGGYDCWVVKISATGTVEWQRTYGGSNEETGYSIRQTTDGGFIFVGSTWSVNGDITYNHGMKDIWVVKLTAAGDILWQKTYGGAASEDGLSIEQTADGGYIVGGATWSTGGDITFNRGRQDFWMLKLNSTGSIQWQKTYGGSNEDRCLTILQTSDGGYVLGGWSRSANGDVTGNHANSADCWIIKVNSAGGLEWQKTLGGDAEEVFLNLRQTSDGGYIIAAQTFSDNGDVTYYRGNGDCWIIKLNSDGHIDWQKTYGGSEEDRATDVQQTPDGGYIVGGYSQSNNGDVSGLHGPAGINPDFWVVKLGTGGAIQWQKALGGGSDDRIASVQVTKDGGYITAGVALSRDGDLTGNFGNWDFWVVRLGEEPTPTATVTPPGCGIPAGTIRVSAPAGSHYLYGINGVYQEANTFSGLAPGTYTMTTKNSLNGCISHPVALEVPVPVSGVIAPTFSIAPPTCSLPSGTITISQPTGATIQYSIGGTYQAGPVFSGLAAGTYTITAKDIATGCVSPAQTATIPSPPTAPPTPAVTITGQPACGQHVGSLAVTAPTGARFQYSTGGAYQASPVFSSLPPGDYRVTVKEVNDGCISLPAGVTIAPIPAVPAPPSVITDSVCEKGTVQLQASGEGVIHWYGDANMTSLVATGPIYSPLVNQSTTFYVTATVNGCVSHPLQVQAVVSQPPPKPFLGKDTTLCSSDQLVLAPGIYDRYQWQDQSTGPTFTVTAPGLYHIRVTSVAGCSSSDTIYVGKQLACDDLYFANSFTPNGDGHNDYFRPLGKVQLVQDFVLNIYNRHGALVFSTRDPYEKWDGKWKGVRQELSNFVWFARYRYDGARKFKKGNLLLIR